MVPGRGLHGGGGTGLLVACALLLSACGGDPRPTPTPAPVTGTSPAPAYDASLPVATAVLALVPAEATAVAVTDFDASRVELGVPDLTSESLMTDRSAYWERARTDTVLLAEGRLRAQSSRLELDHGFTQDDVDWEARWTTPSGTGWVLGLRPGLDLGRVRGALRAGVPGLAGAELDARRRLLGIGFAAEGEETWGDRPEVAALLPDQDVTAVLYRDSCVPVLEALGPDAGVEELQAVTARHDLEDLDELAAFSISFADGLATARLGTDRGDTFARAELAGDWPTTTAPGFTDVLARPVGDPSTGRVGFEVRRAPAAAALALTGELPFAVCPEVPQLPSPSGL